MDKMQVKQSIDLIGLAESAGAKFRKAGRVWQSACPLHGGDCPTAFTVFIGDDGYQHYKCYTRAECNEHGSDVFAFVMKRDNCGFKTAYKTLTGENPQPITTINHELKTKPLPAWCDQGAEWRRAEWQSKAWGLIDKANDNLLQNHSGELGREYLTPRALERGTWAAWWLGFTLVFDVMTQKKRPAIIIPWLDCDTLDNLTVYAVKYRYIDELAKQDKRYRFGAMGGGANVLYGLHNVMPNYKTLLLIEGEMNALSVAQCRPQGVNVLSFGSETGGRAEVLQVAAKEYQRVFVWSDKAEQAKKYQALLNCPCQLRHSPDQEGEKMDANKLLQTGGLAGELFDFLGVECLG